MKNTTLFFILASAVFLTLRCEPTPSKANKIPAEDKEEFLNQPNTQKEEQHEPESKAVAIEPTVEEKSPENAVPKANQPEPSSNPIPSEPPPLDENRESLIDRFAPPDGFERTVESEGSFGHYLQHLPLKPEGSEVKYYNGAVKANPGVYVAVVDMEIGTRDLQQCADAVMRLRGEYLWRQQRYDQIHFNFTNGFRADYEKWRQGYRISVKGNQVSWYKSTQASSSYRQFRKYMDLIFAYAGTASLEKELKTAELSDLQIGDVFIQGGFPGHAVIVVDMAKHRETGEKIFLLAQSYMPAQDIQILQNPNDRALSPWYRLPLDRGLSTPEWNFANGQLKRF